MKEALYFESNEKWLFGVLSGVVSANADTGMVFCHPFAEEKQRVDRVTVKLARQLEESGIPVMRFDCVGYGDSEGDFEESTIESQLADIGAATQLLIEKTGVQKIYLFGVRFGATLATLRAKMDTRVRGLVLWSPIAGGKGYVDTLYRNKIFSTFSDKKSKLKRDDIERMMREEGKVDIDGYYVTSRMVQDLENIDLLEEIDNYEGDLFLGINRKYDKEIDRLEEVFKSAGARVFMCEVEDRVYWDMKTHYEWYFPTDLIEKTKNWIVETIGGA